MTSKPKPDDLEAVRAVISALQEFETKDQQRILRWAQEKLGLPEPASTKALASSSVTPRINERDDSASTTARPPDIKTFIDFKNPQTDIQFAAAVAYYYRFEAPEPQRKASITSDDLQEACRQAGRSRFKVPAQTLGNAHMQGYLDKGSERGTYVLNTVGENLVAMTLPEGASSRIPRRKSSAQTVRKVKGAGRGKKRAR